jgi:hypothetical protein
MRVWAVDDDPWLRRTSVICQIAHGAQVEAGWERAYVDSLGDRLSGLSRREATKHL